MLDDASPSEKQRIPEAAPVFDVVIDEENRNRICPDVLNAPQPARVPRLRLGIDRVVERLAQQDEADRHQRRSLAVRRREMTDSCAGDAPAPAGLDQGDVDMIR
jgi:hypothetical protein